MDSEKLKEWLEITQKMEGGDFWRTIFDQEFAQEFMNDQQAKSPYKAGFEQKPSELFPLIDMIVGEEEVLIHIDLPGVKKNDIELVTNGNILTIKGFAAVMHSRIKPTYAERFSGRFERQINLPDVIQSHQLRAKLVNGLLIVSYQRIK